MNDKTSNMQQKLNLLYLLIKISLRREKYAEKNYIGLN